MAGEYEEIVKKIPVPERAIGPLAGLAARLDYLGPKVQKLEGDLSPKVADLAEKVGKLEYAISKLEFPEGIAMPEVIIEQIPFVRTLDPLKGATLYEYAPFAGKIKSVLIDWPEGCDHLVDVKVGHGVKQFLPKEGYLALNRTTASWTFNDWIQDHEEIWVDMNNGDGVNTHHITVVVNIEGVE